MHLDQLQIFTSIAENKSFTKAAAILNIDKSTASNKLMQLENRLGVRLLNRSTRSVSLTEAGEGYLLYCQQIMETVKEADHFATTLKNDAVGFLRISVPHSFTKFIINELLEPFMVENPKIDVEVAVNSENIDLVHQQVDVALRLDVGSAGLKDSSLIAQKITRTQLGLFCSPSYLNKLGTVKTVEHLYDAHFIQFNRGNSFNFIRELLKKGSDDVTPKSRLKVDDITCCKEAAIAGMGIAVLPIITTRTDLESNQLIQLIEKQVLPSIDLYAIYPSRQYIPAKLKLFLEHLHRLDFHN
ncbi:LysR family transcriptional regulator [Neptunomonas phycophila]|uniref:LysR family transcriptional regulator n=1 Tax=Neptunomonas phycophila TaxID=1572645 RepID=UPI003515529B